MAVAQKEGGLYYVNGKAVDAEGKPVEGAPKQPKDTDPSQQPGALGMQTPEEKLAAAIASAMGGKSAKASTTTAESEDSDELPTLDELEAHIAGMDAKSVKALQKQDERKGAVSIYEARLDAIKAGE